MTKTRLKRITVRLLYVLALVGCVGLIVASMQIGCGAPASHNGNQNPVEQNCDTDADCAANGEVCSTYKVCLARANGGVAIGIELTPPTGSQNLGQTLTQHEIPPWELYYGADGRVRIEYPDAVVMAGALRVFDDGRPLAAMQASVTATRDSRIPGRPKVVVSKTLDAVATYVRPRSEDILSDPDFTLTLPADVSHVIRAAPLAPYDEMYHPTISELTAQSDSTVIFMFGDADTTDYLSGVVVDALGAGVPDVKVRAVDDESGLFVSTLGTTNEHGEFVLAVPRGLRMYKLTFSPSVDNPLVPETTHGAVQCCEHDGNTFNTPQDLGEFMLPAFPMPQTYQFALEGLESSGLTAQVTEATVTFETTVGQPGGVTGTYVATAVSDANGIVQLDLVPGDMSENRQYKVTVVTSPTSEFASEVRAEFSVGPNGGAGEIISLARRVPVTGYIAANSPSLEAITVKARRNDEFTELAGMLLSTVTDADGRYTLLLDPGHFNFEFQPPTSIPLPLWAERQRISVPANNAQGDEVLNANIIIIPDAAVLQVQVDSASLEAPLEGVTVKAYLVDEDCGTVEGGPCDFAAMLLYTATTDANGSARLIVPQW